MIPWLVACAAAPGPIPDALPACDALPALAEPRALEVRLWRGDGVTDAEVARAYGLLAGRVHRWGLELAPVGRVGRVEGSLLGAHPESGQDELAGLRGFLDAHARPAQTAVHLVVVREIVDPRSRLARTVALQGLGLHPEALGSPEGQVIREGLGEAPFTPFLLVDADALDSPDAARSLLAHELGHALGLAHDGTPGNAMNEVRDPTCAAGLTAGQLAALR
ncbi:MAG: hypothetical protein H6737_29850 [Alphaproteobacteria bacterium]|nr:hypothetical protein [Alphaproteobacteria bacterium]